MATGSGVGTLGRRPKGLIIVPTPSFTDLGPGGGAPGPCLVWRLPSPMLGIASTIVGGGLGPVSWVVNLTVDTDYSRVDPADHLGEVAQRLGLEGRGVGFMTAVDVASWSSGAADGATAVATVGARRAIWAASGASVAEPWRAGTINLVAGVPARLHDAALVNAIATITEAKVQALIDARIPGTGTASDAVCLLCPLDGAAELFGGPRSEWGGRLADATYRAVSTGIAKQAKG